MRIPALVNGPLIALTVICAGNVLTSQPAEAHHHPVHSTEQAITEVTKDTSATVKQVAVIGAPGSSLTLLLTVSGATLLGIVGLGLHKARRKQSA